MVFLILFVLIITPMFLLAAAGGGGIHIVHHKTEREEAMHDQIQKAMNWSPDHYYQREDGRWFNGHGQEGVCVTLEELKKKYKRDES